MLSFGMATRYINWKLIILIEFLNDGRGIHLMYGFFFSFKRGSNDIFLYKKQKGDATLMYRLYLFIPLNMWQSLDFICF